MTWWKNAVMYQIYPRSFQDSNGDGIGDIPGIISRLDYLQKLGVTGIWLSPVYDSPNDDNGYDISNYRKIHPDFGTMADMDRLIEEANKRNIKLVMDLVVNHTSDEHRWFEEALKDEENKYRDYYIWRDPVNGKEPNELVSMFGGSAWEFDEASGQYYLHLYSKKQPDLNWANREVRFAVYDMMNFWLDKGIGGFRMDVIDLIGKDPDKMITGNGPKLHEYLKEMHQETLKGRDVMTVGETWGVTPETAPLFASPDRKELSMVFQFEHLTLDEEPGTSKWDLLDLDFLKLKQVFKKWQTELPDKTWNSLFWNNHDTPRIVSRWGSDGKYRESSAKMFAILLHMMKGTPYIYQGEEIGMVNRPIKDISQAEDIESINLYHERIKKGYTHEDVIHSINAKGRDNARTPVQWDTTDNAGFTTGKPWLEVNTNYSIINVEDNLRQPDSVFYTYKKLIRLRKENKVVIYGEFTMLLENHPQLFAYERSYKGEVWIVVANFSDQPCQASLYKERTEFELILSSTDKETYDLNDLLLAPYEAFIVKKKE
ncbi:glucan 1,6-alpha-glucosidase [Alkalibacterium putridalgicola]|uniref:Alpha-glucosidase n=1 Tax=Alkalibacterium putridalgicola TaxID=426703 RepID=A0A1H7QJ21_9LACT|nr:alpha-glucosidase [Alkalibacterium putridalgicola]GEK88455.1 alpha-glucosidase [Alkalibacterium putridalgicola]SEL47769.1 glucan 1,6-alpha-glucosidase [Alkalibacterium putridalgicola]